MAYDKKKIFEQSKEVTVKNKLFFIEDIVAFLPCDKTTFYRYFKPNSEEYNELNELLGQNKIYSRKINDFAINRVPTNIHNNKEGYLYLIKCENSNYYKLGISSICYKNRLSNLQSGCPYKLHMIHVVHSIDYKNIEKEIHLKFNKYRHFGEWFIFTNIEVEKIIKTMDKICKKQLLIEFTNE